MELLIVFYLCFSLLATAMYFNVVTPHSKSERILNYILLWLIPVFWALHLKKHTQVVDATYSYTGTTDSPRWKSIDDKRDIRVTENSFESVGEFSDWEE